MAKRDVYVLGNKEIVKKLKTLDAKIGGKITRKALRDEAKIVAKKVKARVKVKSGRMRKRIKVKSMKRKKGRIGLSITSGEADYAGETFYGPMVEFGHKVGKRGLPNRTEVEGTHDIRDAFEAEKPRSDRRIRKALGAAIEAEAKK